MTVLVTEVLNLTAEDIDGEGALVDVAAYPQIDKNLRPIPKTKALEGGCRFTMNTTAFTGTAMAVSLFAVIGGVDVLIAAFTDVAAISQESIYVEACPDVVKAVYVEDTVTDWDVTIHAFKF